MICGILFYNPLCSSAGDGRYRRDETSHAGVSFECGVPQGRGLGDVRVVHGSLEFPFMTLV